MLLRFKEHDPALFSDSKSRWTTNGPSLYAFMTDAREDICCSLETAVKMPGAAAHKHMVSFLDAVIGGYDPRDYSATSALVQACMYDTESTAGEHADNLVCIAVRRWDSLEGEIEQVQETRMYDRALCDHAGITLEEGFQQFDPAVPGDPGRWM